MLTYACGRWPQALEEEAKKAESEREAEGGTGATTTTCGGSRRATGCAWW